MDRKALGRAAALLAVAMVAVLWMLPQEVANPIVEQGTAVESVSPPTVEPTPNENQGAQSEGIHVRGHWTIEVRDPDGSLASRTEFENALTSTGVKFLTMFIGRTRTVGFWTVAAAGSGVEGPCLFSPTQPAACFMQEAANPAGVGAGNHFHTLTVSGVPTSINDATTGMILSGTATAARDDSIVRVYTQATPCLSSVSPDDCAGGTASGVDGGAVFTSTTLPTPVPVVTGQSILVTVVISFS